MGELLRAEPRAVLVLPAAADASGPAETLLDRAVTAVAGLRSGLDIGPLLADGAADRAIMPVELAPT